MNQINNPKPKEPIKLTEAEQEIIEDIRQVKYGRVIVFIDAGKPYRKEIVAQARIGKNEGGSAGEYITKPKGGAGVEI